MYIMLVSMIRRLKDCKELTYESSPVGPEAAEEFLPCSTCIREHEDAAPELPCTFNLLLPNATRLIGAETHKVDVL